MTASKKTVVLNLRDLPKSVKDGVYIGRGTKWGNPFVITKECTREQAIAKYRAALWKNKTLLNEVRELRGKSLLCFCAPQACHGHVLVSALAWLDSQPAPEPKPEPKLDDPKLIPSRWSTAKRPNEAALDAANARSLAARDRIVGGMGSEFALQRDGDGVARDPLAF